jgi:hypothetical protein
MIVVRHYFVDCYCNNLLVHYVDFHLVVLDDILNRMFPH